MTRASKIDIQNSITKLISEFGSEKVSGTNLVKYCRKHGMPVPSKYLADRKIGPGLYNVSLNLNSKTALKAPSLKKATPEITAPMQVISMVERKKSVINTGPTYIPQPHDGFVKFGNYDQVDAVIASKKFYPIYISGMSGNGKTLMIQQICAKQKRELIQININPQTDEDDLIGGLRLVNGDTLFDDGPVLTAMRRGAILLLDETDRGSNKLMCIQSILEGRPFFVKKTGETIHPVSGFNIVATANTKGRGSNDGRYSAATIIDDAWLERFPVTFMQEYPEEKIERKILENCFSNLTGNKNTEFVDNLILWSTAIRTSFTEGAINDLITTRRLVHIANAYSIFKDRMVAINMCVNRFDDETRSAMVDLYSKVDAAVITASVITATQADLTANIANADAFASTANTTVNF